MGKRLFWLVEKTKQFDPIYYVYQIDVFNLFGYFLSLSLSFSLFSFFIYLFMFNLNCLFLHLPSKHHVKLIVIQCNKTIPLMKQSLALPNLIQVFHNCLGYVVSFMFMFVQLFIYFLCLLLSVCFFFLH